METITFHCKVITPMFLAGADGQTPELRAPSIKGAMRFWWRALNGHLGVKELREKEEAIFGGTNTGGRSKVLIRVLQSPKNISVNELLPHKVKEWHRSPKECFPEDEEFTLKISLVPNKAINLKQIRSLFEVFALLGGLGKRSRRGVGSFQIYKINGQAYEVAETVEKFQSLIKEVNPTFNFESNADYPGIKKIEISSRRISVHEIGKATHEEKSTTSSVQYESTIGAGKPRFASPICISTLPSGKAVITTLDTLSPEPRNVELEIQSNLKNRIL